MQGHGRIIAPDFYVAHREANSGLSTLNRTKTILSIYHQQRQLQKQRGMCLNDTYPFCQQPLSGNCHSICFSKPVLWTATPPRSFFVTRRAQQCRAVRSNSGVDNPKRRGKAPPFWSLGVQGRNRNAPAVLLGVQKGTFSHVREGPLLSALPCGAGDNFTFY